MKAEKLKLIVLFVICSLGAKAQGTATLSFAGSATLDSVKIEDLNNSSSFTLKGSYNFVIQFGVANAIEDIQMSGNPLVYPNPFSQELKLDFLTLGQSTLNVSVFDLSGKVIAQFNKSVEQGSHRFSFKPSSPGMYLIKVSDKSSIYTSKIICTKANSGYPTLEYDGIASTPANRPSLAKANTNTLSSLLIQKGDMLKFTGYSKTNINSVYDYANISKSYNFTFGQNYYKFKNFNIIASKPSFVDIMFSVTDANNKGLDYLKNSDFTVYEDDATASPTETFRNVKKMQQLPYKLKTILLLDNSASLATSLEAIKTSAIKYVQSINDNQEVAIYKFSDTPVLVQDFTTYKPGLENAIKSITLGFPSTNLYGSTVTIMSKWADSYSLTGIVQGSLILFTDGSDTQGSSTLSDVISARGDKKIYVIGLGTEINPTALNQIANPGPSYIIKNTAQLDSIFANIQLDIVQFSNSFYWFNYMSPKRTGTHNLKVESKVNTNTSLTDSYLTGSFSAVGFQSVNSGTYINIQDTKLYGLDTIYCFYTTLLNNQHTYSYCSDKNGLKPFSTDILVLKPTTYWATYPPVYSWSNSNSEICTLEASAYSNVTLHPLVFEGYSTITLKDLANGYTKTLVFTITPIWPVVSTSQPKMITNTGATVGGEVLCYSKTYVTEKGICWSTTPTPNISNEHISIGCCKGVFEYGLTGLRANTTYFARAYATNSAGTSYGWPNDFRTLAPMKSTITTTLSEITATTASSGGSITDDGGAAITKRGVCWSTTTAPDTTLATKTSDGTGIGTFSSSITGLTASTTYYVRAYTTNAAGTAYGNELSFTTTSTPIINGPNVVFDGFTYHSVIIGTQTWIIENLRNTHYRDRTAIPEVTDSTAWINLTTGACCNNNNNAANGIKYGKLYNWYAVHTGKIAPQGWHVATFDEMNALDKYVSTKFGSSSWYPKALAAKSDWISYNNSNDIGYDLTSNNTTGFTALPGSYRDVGVFGDPGYESYWWSSTGDNIDVDHASVMYMASGNNIVGFGNYFPKQFGCSVRCIKD